jgi:pimeloyl-ACP methyl ester carboxylesterase
MANKQTPNVVFITGAFVSNRCWDQWKTYFENKGYNCLAPAWPNKEGEPWKLRNNQPNPEIASIRLNDVIEHYSKIIQALPEKPILIGHSLGGLITQILLERGLALAGVAVHSVAPQGIIPTQFSFYRSTWKALGFFTSTKKAYLMSFKDWQYAFTNGMPLKEQQAAYELITIPESKLGLRDGLTSVAKVDFNKARGPLLILAGDQDHCIPEALNLRNFNKYKNNPSVTDYKLLPGRNHFVLGQPTWQEDADYILGWLDKNTLALIPQKAEEVLV